MAKTTKTLFNRILPSFKKQDILSDVFFTEYTSC